MKNGNSLFSILLIALVVLIGCNNDDGPVQPTNLDPTIETVIIRPEVVEWTGTSDFYVTATDPEEQEMTYSWTVTGGQFVSTTTASHVRWQAPNESGSFGVTVTVSDGVNSVSQTDSITVTANPVLGINEHNLRFDTLDDTLTFTLRNSRTGLLDWEITSETTDGGTWMTLISDAAGTINGGESEALTVVVDRSGLSGGSYTGKFHVTSNGGSDSVSVVMVVAELEASTEFLDFGNELTTMNVTLSNAGGGNLYWFANESQDWMRIAPDSGIVGNDPVTIAVAVYRDGIIGGVYNEPITITSNGGNVTIDVRMTAEPQLVIDPLYIDFGGDVARSFTISNSGFGIMVWDVIEAESWLTVDQDTGSTILDEVDEITLTVDRTGLEYGVHTGVLLVESNGGSEIVDLTLNVGPIIGIGTESLEFGTLYRDLPLTIRNIGTEEMTWTVSENIAWLTVDPANGTTTTEVDIISVSVIRDDLAVDMYNGTITLFCEETEESKNIEVNMTVAEPMLLSYDDGSSENSLWATVAGVWLGVRFTRPEGWDATTIAEVRFSKTSGDHPFNIDLLEGANYNEALDIYFPLRGTTSLLTNVTQGAGWASHEVYRTTTAEQFFVGITYMTPSEPTCNWDESQPCALRTAVRVPDGSSQVFTAANMMLRIYVTPEEAEGAEGMWLEPSEIIVGEQSPVGKVIGSGTSIEDYISKNPNKVIQNK